MKTTLGKIRKLIRESLFNESFETGDLIVPSEDSVKGILYDPGNKQHGMTFILKGGGTGVASQALDYPQETEWGIKVPIWSAGRIFYVDPGAWKSAPEGAHPPQFRPDAAWWARTKEEMETRGRLSDLGIQTGRGRYGTSRWAVWEAPEGLSTEKEVRSAWREHSRGWPVWSVKVISDPETGKWYVNYELDSSG